MFRNDLFERAAHGQQTPRPPVWLMRQAGRTDPAYNALRKREAMPLEDLFRHPELSTEVSLLPKRLGIDAIIFFQDILTLLAPMGCPFVFRPGPVTEDPIRSAAQIEGLANYDVAEALPFVGETLRMVQEELDGEMPVLGFAGAPLTLAVFMIEGKSFGVSADTALQFMRDDPKAMHSLLDKLTEITVNYLKYQIESGAYAVQLFESAAYLVTPQIYNEFALPYQQRIFEALRGLAPTIVFARAWPNIGDLDASGADILSIDSSTTIAEARAIVGETRVIQGNLSNRLLCDGPLEEIERDARDVVEAGGRHGHIFNLDHGLLRETPYENIQS
ncbi:MAG: uroporphyrinogen decarboxylase family protein, partial [Candidatus Hydrogenedentes bacterium]|nr:uroporphyrinogen decarboxylase family protein [Candidatus Hydrogenedentota bacterium]